MRKTLFTAIALFVCLGNANAQDDLDDIFDDGDSNADLRVEIGTDLITTIAGTVNVYGEIDIKDIFGLQAGIGFVPFGYHLDYSRPAIIGNPTYGYNRNIGGGFYYNIAVKYFQAADDSFKWYYYGEFKSLSMTETNTAGTTDLSKITKLKGMVGTGYSLKPFNNIGFDAHIGLFAAIFRQTAVGSTESEPFIASGLDFGIGAYYSF